jgi:hypothetical protein
MTSTIRRCTFCGYETIILKDNIKEERLCEHCNSNLEIIAIENKNNPIKQSGGKK